MALRSGILGCLLDACGCSAPASKAVAEARIKLPATRSFAASTWPDGGGFLLLRCNHSLLASQLCHGAAVIGLAG